MKYILATVLLLVLVFTMFSHQSRAKERRISKDEVEPGNLNLFRTKRGTGSSRADDVEQDYDTYNVRAKPKRIKQLEAIIATNRSKPEIFELKLPEGYDKYAIPKDTYGNPIKVYIQLNIRKILEFDELEETIKLDIAFRVLWTDFRIRDMYNDARIQRRETPQTLESLTAQEIKNKTRTLNNPNMLDLIWKPNLFFESLLHVKQPAIMSAPITLKLIPEVGWFEYLTRIIVVTDCNMDFHYYPADTQTCKFGVRGFSYTKKDLQLAWYKTGVWLHELSLPSFDVQVDNLREYFIIEDDEDPIPDYFDVLAFNIKSRRRLSYHLVQTYLASTFYIVITCLCFLLPARFVEARIGISMTTLLTLTAMFAAVRESTPIVAYIKAIDIWMVGCIIFVFLTLADFTFHTWLQAMKEDCEKKNDSELVSFTKRTKDGHAGGGETESEQMLQMLDLRQRKTSAISTKSVPLTIRSLEDEKVMKYATWLTIMEKYSFVFFIILIAIYTAIYWTWLLSASDYFEWDIDDANNNVNCTEEGF